MTFGDKIRKLRIEKKMTQQKLGAMVGVSYRTIRAWEVDGRYPKRSSLYQKLADAFQCRVSYLMDDNETVCLEQQLMDWCEKRNMSYRRRQSGK